MLQQVLSLARGGVIISPQLSISCTGYQSASEFISTLPVHGRGDWTVYRSSGVTGESITNVTPAVFLCFPSTDHWPAKHSPTSPTTAAWYQIRTDATPRLHNLVTEVFQLLVLKFETVYHLHSGLRTWRLTVSNEDLRPICLHWCNEISAPSDYWFLALYKFSLCMYVSLLLTYIKVYSFTCYLLTYYESDGKDLWELN